MPARDVDSFLEDVYLPLKKSGGTGTVAKSRGLTLVFGALAAIVACLMHDVIAALTVAYNLLVGAIFVPIIAAMLFARGVPTAALVSIVASAVVVVALMFAKGIDSIVPICGGLAVSLILFVGITLARYLRPRRVADRDGSGATRFAKWPRRNAAPRSSTK